MTHEFENLGGDGEIQELEAEEVRLQTVALQTLLLELGTVDQTDQTVNFVVDMLRTINQTDVAIRRNMASKVGRYFQTAQKPETTPDGRERLYAIADTLVLLSWIADATAEFPMADKKEVQARIITSSDVPEAIREKLLVVSEQVIDGEGLDTSNQDELTRIIARIYTEQQNMIADDRLKRHIDTILTTDPVIVEEHAFNPAQSEWISIKSWARFYLLHWLKQNDVYSLETNLNQVRENLESLGISEQDYIAFLDRAKVTLSKDDKK